MVEEASNRERAIELRKEGLSRSQICQALGLKSGGRALDEWLRDVPPPEWTKRPRAKDDLHARAVELRRQGRSYREIRQELQVSKSSLSLWLKEVELSEDQKARLAMLKHVGQTKAARTIQARRLTRQRATIYAARSQVPELAESELFVAGVALYWAEGGKAKPWRPGEQVSLINSDPDVIRLFLRWLALLGIGLDRLVFTISIHESADLGVAERCWRSVVGEDAEFRKPVLKRHNPKTVRKNTGEDYHGCLVVYVRRSTELYRQIAGWWAGIVGATVGGRPMAGLGTLDPAMEVRPLPAEPA